MFNPTAPRRTFLALSATALAALTACGAKGGETESAQESGSTSEPIAAERQSITDSTNGGHAISVSGEAAEYKAVDVQKTGDDEGDEADFYGTNAAVYAENGATLTLDDITVTCDGQHANAVFSYGEGTTINITNSEINTTSNTSGGIMVTGGGTLNASDITVHTTGNSSAAIRSDRGGGTQDVKRGSFTTDGVGSPVIYSTAEVKVQAAQLTSTSSQGVVVEGKNSASLVNCDLTANNTSKNSDKSEWYQAVMIYQSMSGDAAEGQASFTMQGGSLKNANGDIFFVNNTVAVIELASVEISNADTSGNFLRAAAAGWGNEGSNGGQVTLKATDQEIEGTMLVDEVSNLNLYLSSASTFSGAINPEGAAGAVYVELDEDSVWELTADSNITSLTCSDNAIVLNGHTLNVGGAAYVEGSASTGEAIEVTVSQSTGGPGGEPPAGGPGGEPPAGGAGGEPPAKPSGEGGEPPAKPGE